MMVVFPKLILNLLQLAAYSAGLHHLHVIALPLVKHPML